MSTRAELTIFKAWLAQGAVLWWRKDSRGLEEIFSRYEQFFGLKAERLELSCPRPRVYFYEAPDVHHEIKALKERLPQQVSRPDEALILLCAAGHLIPLLYHLPEDGAVNVSLGYPLFRTPLANLFLLYGFGGIPTGGKDLCAAYLRLVKYPYFRVLRLGEKEARVFSLP